MLSTYYLLYNRFVVLYCTNEIKKFKTKRGYRNDYNVSIQRSNQNSAMAMLFTMNSMKDYPGVSFFVNIWIYISLYFTVASCNNINALGAIKHFPRCMLK